MQLDLFPEQDAVSGEVVQLPSARIASRVKRMATELMGMTMSAGRRHWQKHTSEIRRNRKAQGFSSHEIDAELDAYSRAVSIEMDIHLYYRSGPDGAA